eukprot:TRINITY_DN47039_c0_g1_i1.p2 TRINITY_DN47039_c0_g1~~TRINITY_DN47039_c0_g1_i1.p2  ORF type:complete len:106 (-),score=19.80 TRINITY_DN47039_c0_g1_i1:91-408(-)
MVSQLSQQLRHATNQLHNNTRAPNPGSDSSAPNPNPNPTIQRAAGRKRWRLNSHDSARHCVSNPVSYTHLRAHETPEHLVCSLLLEKKKTASRELAEKLDGERAE